MLRAGRNRPLQILVTLALAVAAATAILTLSEHKPFTPYFSSIHPLLVVFIVTITGIFSLYMLDARGWFRIYKKGNIHRGIIFSLSITPILTIAAILLDIIFGFPRDINVPPPEALLFYPVIAYVVEIVFHIVPISLLLMATSLKFRSSKTELQVWSCIFLVCLVEPFFQIYLLPSGSMGYTFQILLWMHLFIFNLLQMYAFRLFDFITMYLFRVTYYLLWHILWGELRLFIIF